MSLAMAAAFFSMTPASGAEGGLWSQTGPMAEARYTHTLTRLLDGKVLAAGRRDVVYQRLASAELYTPDDDPAAGAWSSTGSMNEIRVDHTATLLGDGKVLVAGGLGASNRLASAELYDPDVAPPTNPWFPAGNMEVARSSHTATLLSDGGVLVTGGLDKDRNPLASAELYDPVAGTWSSAGSMAEARLSPTATLLPSGKVLVTGGGYGGESELASAELYDPDTNSWSSAGSMAERRGTHAASLLPNGEVLVAGGLNTVKKGRNWKTNYLASAELYDAVTEAWSSTGGMATARFLPTTTALKDGRVLVAGGWDGDTEAGNGELYDPATGTWSPTSSMVVPRSYHSATLLSDGRVLVAGGQDQDDNTGSAEIYDPVADPQTGTLAGTVTDASSASPIKGVTVTIRETGQSAKTDISGNYTITDVRVGDVTVLAKKPPYRRQLAKEETITNGKTTTLDFALVR